MAGSSGHRVRCSMSLNTICHLHQEIAKHVLRVQSLALRLQVKRLHHAVLTSVGWSGYRFPSATA
jgi:hypothetical protein